MFHQRVLDLDRADPDAADLQHVIGPPGVPVVAIGVARELIAGPDPMALDCVLGPFVLVPVIGAGAVALDQQVADDLVRDLVARVVNDPGLVARHQLAG